MDLRKVKPSKNVVDRTGDDLTKIDWVTLLGREGLENQGINPDEGLAGLTPQDMQRILFQKALEEFGTPYLQQFPPRYRKGRGPLK